GAGSVGARAARQLASTDGVDGVTIADLEPSRVDQVVRAIADERLIGAPIEEWAHGADVGVLAVPAGSHRGEAERLLEAGRHVISVTDDIGETRALLDLDTEARLRDLSVVVGAGFAPGLTCVL